MSDAVCFAAPPWFEAPASGPRAQAVARSASSHSRELRRDGRRPRAASLPTAVVGLAPLAWCPRRYGPASLASAPSCPLCPEVRATPALPAPEVARRPSLPGELWHEVLRHLPVADLARASGVARAWRQAALDVRLPLHAERAWHGLATLLGARDPAAGAGAPLWAVAASLDGHFARLPAAFVVRDATTLLSRYAGWLGARGPAAVHAARFVPDELELDWGFVGALHAVLVQRHLAYAAIAGWRTQVVMASAPADEGDVRLQNHPEVVAHLAMVRRALAKRDPAVVAFALQAVSRGLGLAALQAREVHAQSCAADARRLSRAVRSRAFLDAAYGRLEDYATSTPTAADTPTLRARVTAWSPHAERALLFLVPGIVRAQLTERAQRSPLSYPEALLEAVCHGLAQSVPEDAVAARWRAADRPAHHAIDASALASARALDEGGPLLPLRQEAMAARHCAEDAAYARVLLQERVERLPLFARDAAEAAGANTAAALPSLTRYTAALARRAPGLFAALWAQTDAVRLAEHNERESFAQLLRSPPLGYFPHDGRFAAVVAGNEASARPDHEPAHASPGPWREGPLTKRHRLAAASNFVQDGDETAEPSALPDLLGDLALARAKR